ncbi:M23 family metallopeptidase [Simiduia agarivorans]|uniref:M23 peptidase domain-containing protein n=1 Tax=Simiduia agarivorans (strain DSM 21679 / JCM 13881 / BCRC 17597 / SA1) TaxID=1117647 RepID=K4L3E6_SIMAS|nr:M23 family metallopeptidase [Simiduia agarivorans]AFV00698.1 M23 peptidase domain-containing protein [Simiduia agarivorans SA1 = DSM 21679]
MKVILVSQRHGSTRSFTLGGWTRALVSVCLLGLPAGVGVMAGLEWAKGEGADLFNAEAAGAWRDDLSDQREKIELTRQQAEQQLAAITLRVAELQARLVRLDALGERLTSIAKLDSGEFDFSQPPALGGPESAALGDAYQAPEFVDVIDQLTAQIANREQQLEILETLLAKRKLENDVFLAGRPVSKGWMSSRFGRRTDPFTGRVAWHSGVDFAGKMGSDIISVAAGVVTWASQRQGYGYLVEINHGNGFSTRYAHNSELKVKVGDIVKKGQVIALMGTSGRSTGPHVHFEVYKHGRAVDPAAYIHRAAR